MKYRILGRTGLKVSEIGFGAWAIGGTGYGPTNDQESLQALQTAFEKGVNFFDTADVYGDGWSESLLAEFLKGKKRDEVIIASKAGWDFYHDGNRKNFNSDYLTYACEESLKRLKIEAIDVYQLHNPSLELIKKGEALGALQKLQKAGKIRFIGISIHSEEEGVAAMEDGRVDTLQLVFHLLNQKMADKVFAKAKEKNTGLIAREPLACGLLSGKYQPGHEFVKTDHRRRWTLERMELEFQKIEKIKKVLPTERFSLARAALEYILDFEEISTVIPGVKTKEQALENIKASTDPRLRSQEAFQIRELYQREEIFRQEF